VDLSDRGVAQRRAAVRPASRIALVRPGRAVVDALSIWAVVATPPHLGVQRVEDVGIEVADLSTADERPDVLVEVLPDPLTVRLPPWCSSK